MMVDSRIQYKMYLISKIDDACTSLGMETKRNNFYNLYYKYVSSACCTYSPKVYYKDWGGRLPAMIDRQTGGQADTEREMAVHMARFTCEPCRVRCAATRQSHKASMTEKETCRLTE